jgi:hypothetical protein
VLDELVEVEDIVLDVLEFENGGGDGLKLLHGWLDSRSVAT